MAMTPFALSLLGVESINRRRVSENAEAGPTAPAARAARPSRKPTSYYNPFQTVCSSATDDPPTYAVALRQQPGRINTGRDALPGYTCSVAAEAKLLVHVESINPLDGLSPAEWREVYVVLRGTLLSFHRPKDGGAGKLLRSYTLQHAEIGLASDTQHTVLVPQSRLAHLIPSAARRRAWQKDPDLFRPVRQHILRLRAETDQILLADASEDRIHALIHSLSAAIDISHAIDERSIPRQCTVPRRRRRQQRPNNTGDLSDPALLAEQERILRDMYPSFAARNAASRDDLERASPAEDSPAESTQSPAGEEDDLDLAVIREDFATPSSPPSTQHGNSDNRPTTSRQATSSSVNSTYSADMMYATSAANFDTSGKWQPPHTRTQQQVQRYTRRCMPVLLAESVRASDVLICNGKRMKLNWRMELLEEWELRPPSYKSHGFNNDEDLERATSISQHSASDSGTANNAQASTSVLGREGEDQIAPVEAGLGNLALSKVNSAASTDKVVPRQVLRAKGRDLRHPGSDIHGVVFCF